MSYSLMYIGLSLSIISPSGVDESSPPFIMFSWFVVRIISFAWFVEMRLLIVFIGN